MKNLKYMLIGLLSLLSSCVWAEELHFNDCVEIIGGFYYQPDQQTVDYIIDRRLTKQGTEYRIGNLFFGVWVAQDDLKKVDKKVCEEAHKKSEGK